MRIARLLPFAVVALFPGRAQTPAPDQRNPVIRVTSHLVQVSVVVHDKKGQPVRDLARDDFTVFDENTPQQLATFSITVVEPVVSEAGPRARSDLTFSNRTSRQTTRPTAATIVLFDSLNSRFASVEDLVHAKKELLKFLTSLQPGDPIALYSLAGPRVRVIHEFTDDTASLIRAAQHFSGSPALGSVPVPAIGGGYFQSMGDWLKATHTKEQDAVSRLSTEYTLAALEAIALHMAGIPGRKNLVWISTAFPISLGFDANAMATPTPQTLANVRSLAVGSEPEMESYSTRVKRLAKILNDVDLAVYPLDLRGLMTDSRYHASTPSNAATKTEILAPRMTTIGEMTAPQMATMDLIASETGGAHSTTLTISADTSGEPLMTPV